MFIIYPVSFSQKKQIGVTGWITKALKASNPMSAFSPSFKIRFIVSVFFSERFTLFRNAGYIIQPSLQDCVCIIGIASFQLVIYCVRLYFMGP